MSALRIASGAVGIAAIPPPALARISAIRRTRRSRCCWWAVLHEVWNAMGQAIVIIGPSCRRISRLGYYPTHVEPIDRIGTCRRRALREAKRAMRDRILRARDAIPRRHRAHAGAAIVTALAAHGRIPRRESCSRVARVSERMGDPPAARGRARAGQGRRRAAREPRQAHAGDLRDHRSRARPRPGFSRHRRAAAALRAAAARRHRLGARARRCLSTRTVIA